MRSTILMASLVVALASPTSFADPVDEILSLARRSGYLSDVEVSDEDRYESYGEFYDNGYYQPWHVGPPRRWGNVQRMLGSSAAEELLQMDYLTLRRVARASSADFDRWLSGIPAGEVWRKHFESRAIQEQLAPDVDAPPTADERQAIFRIVDIFDQAVTTAELNDLTRVASAHSSRVAPRTCHAARSKTRTPTVSERTQAESLAKQPPHRGDLAEILSLAGWGRRGSR